MSENFIQREHCPVCEGRGKRQIVSVSFTDPRIWNFLASYYGGRVPKEKVEGVDYSIVQCTKCGCLFQEFILSPSNMYRLYEEWISAEESLNKKKLAGIDVFRGYAFEIENIGKMLRKKPHAVTILEYGMGWGYWADMAQAFGFNVTGVELSQSRIDFAKQRGLRIIHDIEHEPAESYDYIYSNQVFEHLPEPKKVLQDLARVLSPKGIIHLQVPYPGGIERALRDPNWKAGKDALHPLEHINCFSRQSLKILAGQAGLELRRPPYSIKCDTFGSIVKSHIRYLHDVWLSTQVYLVKVS